MRPSSQQIEKRLRVLLQKGAEGGKVIGQRWGSSLPKADVEKVSLADTQPTVNLHGQHKNKSSGISGGVRAVCSRCVSVISNSDFFARATLDFMARRWPLATGNRTKWPPAQITSRALNCGGDNPRSPMVPG